SISHPVHLATEFPTHSKSKTREQVSSLSRTFRCSGIQKEGDRGKDQRANAQLGEEKPITIDGVGSEDTEARMPQGKKKGR
ncbi:MAG: hypothetical protein Q8L38_03260, partial [Pseudohongiella sp.]|nr:hypothetical protein [Pseudohongiella sp.]